MFNINGNTMTIPIPPDEDGYTGRECPECESYFKIVFGTGLKDATDCICPYCGHRASQDHFWTKAQIEYAQSVAFNHFSGEIHRMFKKLERKHRPKRGGIGLGIKVTGRPTPISYYQELELETEVECGNCTLKYAVYGVFGYCPDCALHNSQQILDKNLEIAGKMLNLVKELDSELSEGLINNALEDVVSAFDGFGREICRVYANKSKNPAKASEIRFQSLGSARSDVQSYFGFDFASILTPDEWSSTQRRFQKRHIVAHKSGVVDADYIKKANDPSAIEGRKIKITVDEVADLTSIVRKIGVHILSEMQKLP